jgi:septum formation protein
MKKPLFSTLQPLILASASPRRKLFLSNLGIVFKVVTADIDESPIPGEQPDTFALRMATAKADEVTRSHPSSWIIAADTVVTLQDGTILGKPGNEEEAVRMLKQLVNSTHRVMTGMCLRCAEKAVKQCLLETTEVTFMDVPEDMIRAYVHTGEPMDKAGACGIQGLGSFLVSSIKGSCTNVIGLPVNQLVSQLVQHKIILPTAITP